VLEVQAVEAAYGPFLALSGAALTVHRGEIVALLGPNGAGKTTLIRCITGLLRPRAGLVRFDGEPLGDVPAHAIVERGLAVVPEGRRLFGAMTVEENLELGAFVPRARSRRAAGLERVYAIFPWRHEAIGLGRTEPRRACVRPPTEDAGPAALDAMNAFLQQLVLGLLIGGLYGLAAAGLSLVFGVLKVLNVAHGQLIMLGGYGAFWLFALWGLDPFASLALVVPGALVLGVILYGALFGWVVRAHEETRVKNSLLIGFGLALALDGAAVRLWTADERSITTGYAGAVFAFGGLAVPLVRLASLALAFALIGGLHLLLRRWRWGRAIRATAEDWEAALMTGIDVRRAYLLAFAIG